MICLGSLNAVPSLPTENAAAQLHVLEWFRSHFLRSNPGGLVISELEYMGRGSHSFGNPTPVKIAGNPAQTKIMAALHKDFRRKFTNGDHRKPDVMGIAADGQRAELLEVTTYNNALSARTQLREKLDILHNLVNRNNGLRVDWRASAWKPNPYQMQRLVTSSPNLIRYVCFEPTFLPPVQDGVILYEIHSVLPKPLNVPVPAPKKDVQALQQAVKSQGPVEARVSAYLAAHPDSVSWVQGLAAVLSVAAAIGAIIAVITPVVGDEYAAGTFAALMFRIATQSVKAGAI